MPQPVSYNTGNPVSGSLQDNSISYVVDGQSRDYRGGFGGLDWMSEAPAIENVMFIGNSTSVGRGPAGIPLFYPSFNASDANIIYAANNLPGSPGNLTTLAEAYEWSVSNGFFVNNANDPISRNNTDNLVFYTNAGLPTSYPHTRNTWYDLSGYNHNGTLVNGPTFSTNGWFDFDGADDTVRISSTGLLNTSNGFTGETWCQFDTTAAMVMYHKDNVYSLRRSSNTGLQWADGTNWSYSSWGTTGFATGTIQRFYHIVATKAGSTVTLYGNGDILQSKTFGSSGVGGNTNDLYVGSYDGGSNWMNGKIAKTIIHDKALSQEEIKQSYFQSNIVQDGLVWMLDANNLVSYPKSGTTSWSLTGSNTATLNNGIGYDEDNGGSWVFDGVDDYITTTITPPTGNSPRTVIIWVKVTGTTGNPYYSLCGYGNQSNSQTFDLGFNDLTDKVFLDIYGAGGITSVNTINKNEWYMITGVYTGTQLQLYINDNLEITNNYAINTGTTSFKIADTGWTYPAYLAGNIAMSQIYNRALSSDEISQNYQATKDKFQTLPQIVTDGLSIHLEAKDRDSYPGTGTTWYDLINNVQFVPDNNVPEFNTLGGYVDFENSSNPGDNLKSTIGITGIASLNEYTRMAWINIESSGGGFEVVIANVIGNNADMGLTIRDSRVSFQQYANTYDGGTTYGDYSVAGNSTIPSNTWTHVALSVNRSAQLLNIYINGVLDRSATINLIGNSASNTVLIGGPDADSYSGDRMFDGKIATVMHYDRVLTGDEIAQNYNAGKRHFGL